jgi:hypothetical protein
MLALTVLCSECMYRSVLLRAGAADRRHHWQQFFVRVHVYFYNGPTYFSKRIVPLHNIWMDYFYLL